MAQELASMTGRVAVVTGAGHGLGRAYALELSQLGADVVVNDIASSAIEVADEINKTGARAIASEHAIGTAESAREIVADTLAAFGRIDAIVNNAGIVYGTPADSVTADQLEEMHRVHLVGAVLLSQAAIPQLQRSGQGRIVYTSSSAGVFGLAGMLAYATAKAGVVGAVNVMALELAEAGILVNGVLPMAITNPGRTGGVSTIPQLLGGLATRNLPEHVAPLVCYLCTPACQATGRLYSAIGGRYARVFSASTQGWTAPQDDPPAVAELAEHWQEIESPDAYAVLESLHDEARYAGATFAAARWARDDRIPRSNADGSLVPAKPVQRPSDPTDARSPP
jgi:NAD(P)-dependent dehydrogenase (short-subunit alcohol dehydrogenase family)